MRFLPKRFSAYFANLEEHDKKNRVVLLLAAVALLLFFSLAIALPFKDPLFESFFPKIPSEAQEPDIIAQRKQQVVDYFARNSTSTVCQYRISFALAALYKNTTIDTANSQILNAYNDPTCTVSEDKLAESFAAYFQMPHLWRIYLDPATNSRLTPEAKNALLTMMWKWVNQRSTMSLANRSAWDLYGSENHEVIQASAFLLGLQALRDAPGYGPDKKLADGNPIREHYTAWLGYWMRYFKERAREGLSAEIASPGYAKYTASSYYNVYDFTKSAALKSQAKNFLDLYWADVAQDFSTAGIRAGAETRSYKNNLTFSGIVSGLRIWLNMYDWHGDTGIAADHLQILIPATSSYNPPEILRSIARDTAKPPYAYTSRRIGLLDTTKGVNGETRLPELAGPMYHLKVDGGSYINRYSYVTPEYVLGTLQLDSAKTYSALTDQNRLMGVFFSDNLDSRIIVLGRGVDHCGVSGYAEINGTAGPNTMIVGRDIRVKKSTGTSVFIHDGKLRDNLSSILEEGWLFTNNDKAYVAIRIAEGGYTVAQVSYFLETPTCVEQPVNGEFLNLTNMWSPVIVQLGRASDYASFDDFKTRVKATQFIYTGGKLTYKSLNNDTFEYWSQSTNVAKINSDANLNPPDTYNSPFMKGVHGEGTVTVNYGGQTLTINTDCTPVGSDDCSAAIPTQSVSLTPNADTFVEKENPDKNYGSHSNARVDANPKDTALLKFDTSTLAGKAVVSAKLRLYVTDASGVQVSLLGAGESWGENGVTWDTRPNIGSLITSIPPSPLNTYVEVDITSYITPRIGQKIAFALNTASTDPFWFATKETTNKPQLVITYQ